MKKVLIVYDDWIELYNPTNQSLNLSGLFLVEGSDQWQFPDTTSTIPPGEFINTKKMILIK